MNRVAPRAAITALILLLTVSLTVPAGAQEDGGFTPIPVIAGMKLLDGGTEAPHFTVSDLAGNSFDFSQEYSKQAHILVFWSIFCEPCREEMPILERISNQYKGKGLEVLAVNLDGDPFLESVRGFISQGKYSFTVLMDELEEEMFKIADPYNVAGTPVMYFVSNKGEIVFHHLGRITAEDLIRKIEEALAS